MCAATVSFTYSPGLDDPPFANVRLRGSWDNAGRSSCVWSTQPMAAAADADGAPAWRADVAFDDSQVGQAFAWGVVLDGPAGADLWGIAAEPDDVNRSDRVRDFILQAAGGAQSYALTLCRRLGPQRLADGSIRFSVWAPNATAVTLVIADPAIGYVGNDDSGVTDTIPMSLGEQGVWATAADPLLADFGNIVGSNYMFRITMGDGSTAYRTDMHSRKQAGSGDIDPGGAAYAGNPAALDGPQSCSIVCDPSSIDGMQATDFWADEFDPDHPLPATLQDLMIYELHVGALGFAHPDPGTLDDAIALLDHLQELGINAIELMPIAEYNGRFSWGYGSAQFFVIDGAVGGRERLQAFVKACHQRGIAVLLDVCYNHFDQDAERAEWQYDSRDPTRNIYVWYEGTPSDYADPTMGYVDNQSTGFDPRFREEMVRQIFISSAAFLVETCHIDGFRLDQTSSIHEYPVHFKTNTPVDSAKAFGVKFLQQWTRTLRLLRPSLFLTAEDYSNWSAMTEPSLTGDGLGFDGTWFGDFQHDLVQNNGNFANLIAQCGFGDDRPLRMSGFATSLATAAAAKIVYPQSHDDCGNSEGSARTIVLAVNGAPLIGDTRRWGEARTRVAAALTVLSPGTPMFFMGEEIGAQKPYTVMDFMANREDIPGDARGAGANLYGYFRDLIRLGTRAPAIRSRNIAVAMADDVNRVIAFHRWDDTTELLVVACLSNAGFPHGYVLRGERLGDAGWTEIFNSDAAIYGGWNTGNAGATVPARNGTLNLVLPPAGALVLRRH